MPTLQRNQRRHVRRRVIAALAAVACAVGTAGCSGGAGAEVAMAASPGPANILRLGFFANLTHAPALVAVRNGLLQRELGATRLQAQVFSAGPSAVEALFAGSIDAAYLGPSPTINAFGRSSGEALRIVSGATAGGAQLVVRPGIRSAADLKGANLASPQLGGTQDIALRTWLTANRIKNSPRGDGQVTITPTENAQTLRLFQQGAIDGAWLPEPWASRLVLEAGAHVLVDERTLWPKGTFLTTHLVVTTKFLRAHPHTVEALLRANVDAIDWMNTHPSAARRTVNAEIEKASGKPLPDDVLARAFPNITVTVDPLAHTLPRLLAHGVAAGLTRDTDLKGIYDLRLLNQVLRQDNRPAVSAAGLGQE